MLVWIGKVLPILRVEAQQLINPTSGLKGIQVGIIYRVAALPQISNTVFGKRGVTSESTPSGQL